MSTANAPVIADSEIERAIDELVARNRGGEQVVIPGQANELGTISSASHKAFGTDALMPGEGKNRAMFKTWDDPSRHMNTQYRDYMLAKSLKEAGYPFACPWDSMGEFLQEGWRAKAAGRRDEFTGKHSETFKGMRDMGGFFKARGLSSTVGEDGGFLLNPEIAPKIETLFVQNDLASRVDTLPTNATVYNIPRVKDLDRNDGTRNGGVMHYWIDEADPGNESRPKLAFTEIRMRKLVVFVFMTTEIMNDTPYAVETYVRNAVREEINFALSRAIMWGNGINEPLGFARSGAVITEAAEGSQTAGTFLAENALKMSARMWRNSAGSAVWLHHQSVIPQIGKMSIGNFPVTVNIQNGGLAGPVTSTLLNRPLIESELCSPLGSPGDVWYADLKQYKAITQSLVREDVSIHVEFMTDQQCLRFVVRFGGSPLLPTPITPFKSPDAASNPPTQSSFIRLASR
jgi:HK97 family phage major capsid protein